MKTEITKEQKAAMQAGRKRNLSKTYTREAVEEALGTSDEAAVQGVLRRLRQMPASRRKTYFDAIAGEASPRLTIKAFCVECMGFDLSEAKRCTARACPLHRYRP